MERIFPGNARVGPDAALRRRPLPGSARVSRVGFGVSPKQAFEKSARETRATNPETAGWQPALPGFRKSALNSATVGRAQFCFAQRT
jgi:hypothetical protein